MKSLIPILAVLALLPGCSSVVTLSAFNHPERMEEGGDWQISRVYSGVTNDIGFLKEGGADTLGLVIDLPFSFVLDTLVLPYTIYSQVKDGHLREATVSNEATD